jgi:K+-sensing histidine kinase KdpD
MAADGETTDSTLFAAQVSSACHDLRTPLATVFGFARTLERHGGLDERQGRYVGMVIAASQELIRLIDDLAVLARIEAGTFVPRAEAVDVRDLAVEAAAEATDRLQSSREVRGPSASVSATVMTDRKLAAGALASLAESALRLEPRRPAIALEVSADGSVQLGPLGEEATLQLERDGDELRLIAARVVLAKLGAQLGPSRDGLTVAFAT